MRLIDADDLKQKVAAMTVRYNLNPKKCNTICELIDSQPTIQLQNKRMMTIKEYNKEFLPTINNAKVFLHCLEHAMQKTNDYEGAVKQL